MVLLSANARRFVDFAIGRLPASDRKLMWTAWSEANPKAFGPSDVQKSHAPKIPPEFVNIAIFALDKMASDMESNRLSLTESDDAATHDNDLSYITSIREALKSEAVVTPGR